MFSNKPNSKVSGVSTDGDKTSFTWTVGKVKTCSFGDSIPSDIIRAGGSKWKMVYFPKGFTDPDYASLYMTNIECETDEGDPSNPDRITKQAFATLHVTMMPEPEELEDEKKTDGPKVEDYDDADEDDDGGESVFAPSTAKNAGGSSQNGSKAGSKKAAGAKSASGSSVRRDGVMAQAPGVDEDKKTKKVAIEPVKRELSQLFTNKDSSWGFEKMFDIGLLYNPKMGYMRKFGKDREKIQSGQIEMQIEIFASSGIKTDDPVKEEDLTEHGRQRTHWTVHDLKNLMSKIGSNKRISSSEFNSDGDWYFDLFPNGYNLYDSNGMMKDGRTGAMRKPEKEEQYLSLYLHSTRRQVELGDVIKTWFRLGIKRANPDDAEAKRPGFDSVYFPKGSSCVSVFKPKQKCFGKQQFIPLIDIEKGPLKQVTDKQGVVKEERSNPKEFVIGTYDKGGSVTFVLDLLVTDDEAGDVQHMLHEIETFGHKHDKCTETDVPLAVSWLPDGGKWLPGGGTWVPGVSGKVICYHCGKPFSKEVTNYQARMEEYGYEVGRDYITDILMREEEHYLDGLVKKLNPKDKFDQGVKEISKMVATLRITPQAQAQALDEGFEDGEQQVEGQADIEKRKKEEAAQKAFEDKIKELRGEVEDAHFSKPVCSKCAEKRKMLQALPYVFANRRPLTADEKSKFKDNPTFLREDDYFKEHPELQDLIKPNSFTCPDQNEILADTKYLTQYKIKKVPNFRKGWKEKKRMHEKKYAMMEEAMRTVEVKTDVHRVVHAWDDWILNRLKKNPDGSRPDPMSRPGRNAMTLVRGNILVEPLELARQCAGRVNKDGITPKEDEDAPRDAFCDVRFDVRPEKREGVSKPIYCLYSGKVHCNFCCSDKHKLPLPMFEERPSEAQPVQVSFDSKEKVQQQHFRITPVSKREEPEVVPRRRGGVEEEEEEEEPLLERMDGWLRGVPLCGAGLADLIPQE